MVTPLPPRFSGFYWEVNLTDGGVFGTLVLLFNRPPWLPQSNEVVVVVVVAWGVKIKLGSSFSLSLHPIHPSFFGIPKCLHNCYRQVSPLKLFARKSVPLQAMGLPAEERGGRKPGGAVSDPEGLARSGQILDSVAPKRSHLDRGGTGHSRAPSETDRPRLSWKES